MTFWRQVRVIVANDLRVERRTLEVVGVTFPFAIAALIAFALAVGIDAPLLERIGPSLYWVVILIFSVLIILRSSGHGSGAQRDLMRLLASDPGVTTVASGLSAALIMFIFEILLLPVAMVLFNWTPGTWSWLITLPLVALGLGLLGSLVNAVTSSLNSRTSLSAILIVPGSIPLLIAATNALEATTYGRGILPWLLLLLAVNLGLGIAVVVLAGPIDDL